ncbi:MBL fold metallo-hydrolase [Paenibacillus peoriae]|uniref:MBL fold metallo-hydrolase n=1 Tax=Paenibacillus peoriae TaxID=59893 RepID=UPI00096F05EB|nr:MBL fold metallo-hydrolase [Paenibacillus peoriae]OMF78216.1 MBL fold metallo-hydrolase [Paenibacillus peoriae]
MNLTFHMEQLRACFMNFINYVYFVMDEKTRDIAIVDPSWDLLKVESYLQHLNGDLKAILLTHSHWDHINLVNPLLEKYNPQVFMSTNEIDFYHFRCRNLHSIKDKDSIKVGETEIKSLLTPGHTAGSVCYLLSDRLFTGDTIFIEGCGFCDPNGGNPIELYNSVQKIKREIDDSIQIYPAHSFGKAPGFTLNHLMDENIYFQFTSKESFIKFRMRPNQKGLFDFK